MTNVPVFRFKGFSDVWEQCRLGDVAEITSGGTPSRDISDYWNGEIPWATTTEVNYSLIEHTAESITKSGLDNSSAKTMLPKARKKSKKKESLSKSKRFSLKTVVRGLHDLKLVPFPAFLLAGALISPFSSPRRYFNAFLGWIHLFFKLD